MKTNFKLHLATSKDKLRPVMQSILINQKEIVATDANILAVIPTEEIIQDGKELIPEDGLLIDSQIWKAIYNADSIYLRDTEEGIKIGGFFLNKPNLEFNTFKNKEFGTYPRYDQVVPQETAREDQARIGINAKLLQNLSEALNTPDGLKLEFNGKKKAIVARPIKKANDQEEAKRYGLIMQINID